MNEKEFEKLPDKEKINLLIAEGKFIATRGGEHFVLNLYSFENFFVEATYNVDKHSVEKVYVLRDDSELDIYIDEMNAKEKNRYPV
ncbi:MAG: hypothetical protein ACOCYF_01945 [Bacteroidota bacterium]